MENAITAQQAQLGKLAKAVHHTRKTAPRVGTDPFLKMGRDGVWLYGQGNIEVQPGSLWALSPLSYRSGYTCWTDHPVDPKTKKAKKNTNLGKVTVPLGDDPVDINTLPEHIDADTGQRWAWTDLVEVQAVCLTGEDKGTQVLYQTSSVGGLRLMSEYIDKLEDQVAAGKPVAIVELLSDHYENAQWGRTYIPQFEYVEWRALDDDAVPGGAEAIEGGGAPEEEPEPEADKAPKTRRRRPAAGAAVRADVDGAADEAEGPAPKPTRRRRPAA